MRFVPAALLAACLFLQLPAFAANAAEPEAAKAPVFEMDEYVVTGTSSATQIRDIAKNVTVITREDIEKSSAQNLVDLLGREQGLTARHNFGTDSWAAIDMRGQGDGAPTNVLVLVDGHRLNTTDLRSPDLTTVALSQIERIEIVRGPGSVRYGNNAIGGVINIITKKGRGVPSGGSLRAQYGSYATSDLSANLHGSKDALSLAASAAWHESDGYRDNNELDRKDLSVALGFDPSDNVSLGLTLLAHEDEYGMPGGVAAANADDRDLRTGASSLTDHGETRDQRVMGNADFDFGSAGTLATTLGLRHRENPYVWYSASKIEEDTVDFSAAHTLPFDLLGREHSVTAGVDGFSTGYERTSGSSTAIDADVTSLGGFMQGTFALTEDLSFQIGGRYNSFRTEGTFKGNDVERMWNKTVYDLGLVYSLGEMGSVYATHATGYRTPCVDELGKAVSGLKPQSTKNYEIGTHLKPLDNLSFSAAVFRVENEDEIYYDGTAMGGAGANANYDDKTIRDGVELGVKYLPVEPLTLWANYTWMKATFDDTDETVPLVPENTVSAGLDWQIIKPLTFSLSGTWVSDQYRGSDTGNEYDRLNAYTVVDTKLTYRYSERLTLFCGVNNLFDELYSTLAYASSWSVDDYPMPERNFFGGMEWTF
ncbi:iron complex outermembrane receptor protein [Desulfobaculum xiamenense]|uniref:Iron complex outermembrane receptor protein n=1 Tax=Desulfobaculum xiamenense TaxID=995050 RepID=A0A846QIQ3_9BACT|nr:TonB-dependent receptor [Desulfobaculum xiamenense]NJB68118.1 iron complex outermembrane receptor protein [Desulfobaculum xiamenense]